MTKLSVQNKKGEKVFPDIETDYIPDVGEWIWEGEVKYEVSAKVIEFNRRNKRFDVVLIVE